MTKFLTLTTRGLLSLALFSMLMRCSDEGFIAEPTLDTSADVNIVDGQTVNDCSGCTYVVPADNRIIDGIALGLKPGDVIGLDARVNYTTLVFRNIHGTLDNPIIIRNCGGTARVDGTGKGYAILTQNSSYFRITGGDVKGSYGIIATGGTMTLKLTKLSTHFEVDHVEVQNSSFAGIMAKTDPSCDPATWRENFLMKGIAIHNNYIHDTAGEGIYAGNSFFMGMNTSCGLKLPHEIHYIRIFGNIVKNTGWDGIQLGCATKGASIHANVIENYGTANIRGQNNGIQIGAGTGGVCYNNLVKGGSGNGIIVMGLGDNVVHDNVIDVAGGNGIFCDERYSPGPGFKFINNTILSPALDGILIYADLVPMNVIMNNIIAHPGSYSSYSEPDGIAFVHRLNANVKVEMSNNYFSVDGSDLQMLDGSNPTYKVSSTSPVIDRGADITAYNIHRDFNYKPRLRGGAYDIGAVEQY